MASYKVQADIIIDKYGRCLVKDSIVSEELFSESALIALVDNKALEKVAIAQEADPPAENKKPEGKK